MTRLGALALLSVCGCAALVAQSNFATLRGGVEDPQQRPVTGAVVQLKSVATGEVRTATVNNDGLFEIAALKPGEWALEIRAAGFAPVNRTVQLEVDQQMRLDLTLHLGPEKTSVDVVGRAEVLKTSDASVGEVIEPQSIRELPLNGRMLLDLAIIVPGSHMSHGAQTGETNPLYWRPGQASAISVGGNRPNANYFLLDGVINTDPTFNTQNFSASPDAVREFQVQTGSYSADLGGAGGGQINIITKAGTSHFHGNAYNYLRNNALDARTWNEMPGTTFLVQNNFGGSLGGPIYGKRTFFFANYEGHRRREAQTSIATVPTDQEALGDFSESGVTIYDPTTSHANPNFNHALPVSASNPQVLRMPFSNNVIPPERLNLAAFKMLQSYVPRPNMENGMMGGMTMMGTPTVVGSAGMDSNNLLDVRDARIDSDQGTIRVDRIFDRGDSLNVRYSASGEAGFMPQNLPGYGFNHDNLGQNGAIIWTRIISPNV